MCADGFDVDPCSQAYRPIFEAYRSMGADGGAQVGQRARRRARDDDEDDDSMETEDAP